MGSSMAPAVLREQLRRAFDLQLSKRELGAIVTDIDLDGGGTIDGAEVCARSS
jgi:hypothetical protein